MKYCLLFELDSIQDYLFSSGRMRDLIGASELLDRLTNETQRGDGLLDAVCEAAGIQDRVAFSRRAGGAFYAFSDEEAPLRRLAVLWTLALQQLAPHLAYSLGRGSGEDEAAAFDQARAALRRDGSRYRPVLPSASPLAERSRRTGLAGVATGRSKDGVIDAAVATHRRFADMSDSQFLGRFAPEGSGIGWRDWPRQLEPDPDDREGAFPFEGEDRTLALIHADGNGLGKILQVLKQVASGETGEDGNKRDFVSLYRGFSKLIEAVTVRAARQASAEVLLPKRREGQCLAARPILLAGDDITLLVRADLGMDYVRAFAAGFEHESRSALADFAREHGIGSGEAQLPPRLTLGIGLVYLRASQPFRAGIELAEALTREAKRRAKRLCEDDPESSIVFLRVTATLIDDYQRQVRQTMTHRFGEERFEDTLGAYFLGGEAAPQLQDLLGLASLLGAREMARGPTRQLLTLMGQDEHDARRRYRRWKQLMQKHRKRYLDRFEECLASLMPGEIRHEELPYARREEPGEDEWHSPLGDALALLGAGYRPDGEQSKEAAA